jgi:hypothetical protein
MQTNPIQTTSEPALDEFTLAYIMAALWTYDENAPSGEFSTSGRFEILFPQIGRETLLKMVEDCARFQREADLTDYPTKQAGHDFWLTRNHHGCGFWENDYGTESQCKKLTEFSHGFGEVDLYEGDDGKIYG